MLLLSDVLSVEDVRDTVERLDSGEYDAARLGASLLANLGEHPLFQLAVQPSRTSAFGFQRFPELCPASSTADETRIAQLRRDVSVILRLTRNDQFDGGEITVDPGFGPGPVALKPGAAVVFPATSTCHVSPVTRGSFWLAQATVESRIRD